VTFTFQVTLPSGELLFTRTRGTVRWVRALYGVRLRSQRTTHTAPARKLWFLRFWGPMPGDWRKRIKRRWSMWVQNDTLARQLAFLWDKQSKEHTSAFVRGSEYLRTKKLQRPHSYGKAPF